MHAERINANRKYQAALRVWRAASMGSDLAAWQAADNAMELARNALVAAQIKWPTKAEVAHDWREAYRANRGLRVNK